MQKIIISISISILIILSVVFFFLYPKHKQLTGSLCPDDYTTAEEATAAMVTFTNQFYDAYPGASVAQFSDARYQFYVDHNCTAAMERYNRAKSGNLTAEDKSTMDVIDKVIDNYHEK